MKKYTLGKKALELLEENGYHLRSKENMVFIKRSPGIMGIIVIVIITLFLIIPFFSAGLGYGVGLIATVFGVVLANRLYFSDRSRFVLDNDKKTFSAKIGTYHQESQPLSMITSLILHSKFVDEYVSATRNSVEEYMISIQIQLINKENITLLKLKSEQFEPNPEIDEIYYFLENSVKEAKAA
ncbi:MAG: hypothetical protein AAGC64_13200 [Bacteroidota bacterium]